MMPTGVFASGSRARKYADAALAGAVVSMVGMMIVPLPTLLLDVLIATNIAVAVLMLLVAMYIEGGLGFTAFPTVLLVTTLYRLALNVSSTRLILLQADAGEVIGAFGDFVVQGSYVVGAVVFLILTLIQFLVVARGSERVAEVGARFTLDAMPGKQMSIDAELRSGTLTQDGARRRRRLLQRESQFYGAMDGAMKFVKGDAIAGLVITAINIVGGLAIGIGLHGMELGQALETFGLLTIGDGLVSQIPALLISTAAGLVVTRVASEEEDTSLGSDIAAQVFGNPRALTIAAVFLAGLAVVPGVPALPFLLMGSLFGLVSHRLGVRAARGGSGDAGERGDRHTRIPGVVPAALDMGPQLASRVLSPGGEGPLVERAIPAVRDALFEDLGVILPPVRTRARPDLPPDAYVVALQEVAVARGEVSATDDATAVVADRLAVAVRRRAGDLIGLQEAQGMLDQLEGPYPALVRNVVPKAVSLPLLADVLRRLVDEGVSIRPLREILEALAIHAPTEADPEALTERVRAALGRHLCARHATDGELRVLRLHPDLEEAIRDAIHRTTQGPRLALSPDQARDIVAAVRRACAGAEGGPRPVLLTQPDVRRFVRRLLAVELPDVAVLSHRELDPERTVHVLGRVALDGRAVA
ncbi:MAG: FHIPEP family type III secretion protein [Myxococcota bacterium]